MPERLELSGYDQHKVVLAQRYQRGPGRWVYMISLPLHLVPTHLPIPDPDVPFPGNRRVNRLHADRFAQYWRKDPKWATPPLLLDTVYPLSDGFSGLYATAGVEFGKLALPHNSATELDILDGQHRILGWKLVSDQLAQELKKARTDLQLSRDVANDVGVAEAERRVALLTGEQNRLTSEYVSLEVMEGITIDEHKQIFHDIAANAKGISKSLTVSFDRRSVLNRIAMDLAENHPLLGGRVDMEKDRIQGSNENLISGRSLVDLVRHVTLGIDGRMTVRREGEMRESAIADLAEAFLAALTDSFPSLRSVMDGDMEPFDLREKSLLGSATVLRVLAGAYHDLAVSLEDAAMPFVVRAGDAKARKLFKSLSHDMSFPVGSRWMSTGYFGDPSAKAPSSRAQDLKGLSKKIASWAE